MHLFLKKRIATALNENAMAMTYKCPTYFYMRFNNCEQKSHGVQTACL